MEDKIRKLYKLLDLEPGASIENVKRAFRELSHIWHPDNHFKKSEGVQARAEEKFKEISQAYQELKEHLGKEEDRSVQEEREAEETRRRKEEEARQEREKESRRAEEQKKREQEERARKEREQRERDRKIRKEREENIRKKAEQSKRENQKTSVDIEENGGEINGGFFWFLSVIFFIGCLLIFFKSMGLSE
jgi:curved DNA-binding protein CbpA